MTSASSSLGGDTGAAIGRIVTVIWYVSSVISRATKLSPPKLTVAPVCGRFELLSATTNASEPPLRKNWLTATATSPNAPAALANAALRTKPPNWR